jgi:hypothetical protein
MPPLTQLNTRVDPKIRTALDQAAYEQRMMGHSAYSSMTGVLGAVLHTFFTAFATCRANSEVDPSRIFGQSFAELYQTLYPKKEVTDNGPE